MPAITNRFQNLAMSGAQVAVSVGVSSRYVEALSIGPEAAPRPVDGLALIDTGATFTVIRAGLADALGLRPVGEQSIATASSDSVLCNQYEVNLIFTAQRVGFQNLVVIEAPIIPQPVVCLIGRDVLRLGVFVYIGYDNSFTLAF
jgi:predicted aspartyl protease